MFQARLQHRRRRWRLVATAAGAGACCSSEPAAGGSAASAGGFTEARWTRMPAPCCSDRRETGAPSGKAASAEEREARTPALRRRDRREANVVRVDTGSVRNHTASEEHYAARRRVRQRSAITEARGARMPAPCRSDRREAASGRSAVAQGSDRRSAFTGARGARMPASCCSHRRETVTPSRKAATAVASLAREARTPQRQEGGRRGHAIQHGQ